MVNAGRRPIARPPGFLDNTYLVVAISFALMLLAALASAGCNIVTFGNLSPTATVTSGTTTGGGSTGFGPHLPETSFAVGSLNAAEHPVVANVSGKTFVSFWDEPQAGPASAPTPNGIHGTQLVFGNTGAAPASNPRLISLTTNNQTVQRPAVAVMPTNPTSMLVVWQEVGPGVTIPVSKIMARPVTALSDGTLTATSTSPIVISTNTARDAVMPAISASPNSQPYLVVYVQNDESTAGYGQQIFGRRLNSNGTPASAPFLIYRSMSNPVNAAVRPRLVGNMSSTNTGTEFLAMWCTTAPSLQEVLATFISDALAISPISISVRMDTNGPTSPEVAFAAAQNAYLTIWRENPGGTGTPLLDFTPLAAGAASVNGPVQLTTAQTGQDAPVASFGSLANEYLVTWHDARNGVLNVFARFMAYQTDGSLAVQESADTALATSTTIPSTDPDVAYDTATGFWLVVYAQNSVIRGQRVSPTF